MELALVKNLLTGAGSSSQFIGRLVVALLYVVIGLLSAIGSILVVRRIFQGRWEQIFWASFLVVIAAFYLSFAAYFGASTQAWQTGFRNRFVVALNWAWSYVTFQRGSRLITDLYARLEDMRRLPEPTFVRRRARIFCFGDRPGGTFAWKCTRFGTSWPSPGR